MRRSVRRGLSVACLAAAVCVGLFGSILWKKNHLTEIGVTLTAPCSYASSEGTAGSAAGITLRQVEQIRETEYEKENPVDFTAWCEEEEKRVTDVDGYRSAAVTVLRLCGRSEYLIPYGKVLQEADTEGCLLGAKTADQLFGSLNVEGMSVLYGGREFIVRGVLEEPAEIFIMQEADDTMIFDRITLARTHTSKEKIREFCDGYGLGGMVATNIEQSLWEMLLTLVPGKWSDFDGWASNMKSRADEETEKQKVAKSSLEVRDAENRRIAVILLVCSGALLVFGLSVAGKELEH